MTRWSILFAVAAAFLVLPAVSLAQGLGDIAARARRDREQRSSEGDSQQPVKTFTNADLPEREEGDDDDDEGAATDAEGGSSRRASDDSRNMSAQEREADLVRARTRVERLEQKVEELQQKLNPMSTTYIYGGTGGPVGGGQADEEIAVRRQLDAAQAQLEGARDDVAEAERGSRSAPPSERTEDAGY